MTSFTGFRMVPIPNSRLPIPESVSHQPSGILLVVHTLQRYLVRETFWLYLLGVAAFCLLLSIDMLALWARFLVNYSATPAQVGALMLYRLPWFLHLSLPVAVVFAVLLATGRLAKDSELKAAYASGVRPLWLLIPPILFGLGVALLTLVNNGYVEPPSQIRYDQLVDGFVYDKPPPETQSDVAYRVPDVGVFYAGRVRADEFDSDRAELSGVLVIEEDGATLTAPSGVWDSSREGASWTLFDAQVSEPGATPRLVAELTLPFGNPLQASESLGSSAQLTLGQLWRRLQLERQTGGEVRELNYDFHRRLADAFSAVIFALIAGVMGLNLHRRSAGFAWTIVLIALFWALWTLSGNFFEQGVLGPAAAAWLTSIVIGSFGLLLAWWRLR